MDDKQPKSFIPPLSGGYMASSMLGFIISIVFVFQYSRPFGTAFALVFAAMFFAAIKSMTYTPPELFVEIEKKIEPKKKIDLIKELKAKNAKLEARIIHLETE